MSYGGRGAICLLKGFLRARRKRRAKRRARAFLLDFCRISARMGVAKNRLKKSFFEKKYSWASIIDLCLWVEPHRRNFFENSQKGAP
jgi:hypothetical protein